MYVQMIKFFNNYEIHAVNRVTGTGNRQLTGYLVTSPFIKGEVNRLGNLLVFEEVF